MRHQLNVLKRKSLKRLAFSNFDRLVFSGLYWIAPLVVNALVIVKPETVIRWHRAGFRMFWGLVTSERPHLARPAPVMTTFMPFMNTLSSIHVAGRYGAIPVIQGIITFRLRR